MRIRTACACGALFIATLSGSGIAQAQTSADKALAETLYQEGRRLMQEEQYDEACPKFAESQRLDPGTGTLLNLAVCHEAQGKLATAWAEFTEARVASRRDNRADRVALAEQHIEKLKPRLSYLQIEVGPAAKIEGFIVKLDGNELGKAAWGVPAPVDPGQHVVSAGAPDRKPWSKVVMISPEASRDTVTVPVLEPTKPLAPEPTESAEAAEPKPGAPAPVQGDQGAADEGPPAAAWIVGGVGVAALAVGGVFGLRAFSKWDEREQNCPDGRCNQQAVDAGDDAKTAATISNIGIGLGIVGIGVATVLIVSSGGSEEEARVDAALGPGSVLLRGRW